MKKQTSYTHRLLSELDDLAEHYVEALSSSQIGAHNWDSGFIGFPHFYWLDSSTDLQALRMRLLAQVKDLEPRMRLLFPHPTPEVRGVLKESFDCFGAGPSAGAATTPFQVRSSRRRSPRLKP